MPARAPGLEKSKSRFTYWHYVAIVILVFLGGTWYVQNKTSKPASLANQATTQPQLHTQGTGDKAFTVNAGSIYSFTFEMPVGAFNANLKGHFVATGGVGNDVEVLVLSEDDFVNWRNGHSVKTLYNSGRVTQETLNVSVPPNPGKYILVFSNKFSILTPKAVQADVQLSYYTR